MCTLIKQKQVPGWKFRLKEIFSYLCKTVEEILRILWSERALWLLRKTADIRGMTRTDKQRWEKRAVEIEIWTDNEGQVRKRDKKRMCFVTRRWQIWCSGWKTQKKGGGKTEERDRRKRKKQEMEGKGKGQGWWETTERHGCNVRGRMNVRQNECMKGRAGVIIGQMK